MGFLFQVLNFILYTTRLVFGTGILSEFLGSILLRFWPYTYSPLPVIAKDDSQANRVKPQDATIRILKVEQVGKRTGVRCSLTNLEGLQSQEYYCLSYTWADPFGPDVDYVIQSRSYLEIRLARISPVLLKYYKKLRRFFQPERYIINIDDGFLAVNSNLWNAFVHLHKTRPEFRAIWIDAICIDQSNIDEKSAQIPIMNHIYGHAKSVIAWLGPEDKRNENPRLVTDVVIALRKQEEAKERFCAQMLGMTWNESFAEFPAPEYIRNLGFEHWFAVRNFLRRPYFQRMWIFQELIVAEEIVVACGAQIIDWNDLQNISQAFSTFGCDIMTRFSRAGSWVGAANSPHRVAFWRDQYRSKPIERLRKQFGPFILLFNRNDFRCTDGRDMLYAHMGVCNYDRIVPDCAKPLGQVYTEFWADILGRVPSPVNFLTYVEDASCSVNRSTSAPHLQHPVWNFVQNSVRNLGRKKADPEKVSLPSWVPDFQAKLEPPSLTQHYYERCFSASSGPEEIPLFVDHSNNNLILHGFLFDTVAGTSESGQELMQNNSIIRMIRLMEETYAYHGISYPTNEHPFEAVWKTMAILTDIGGEKDKDYPPPSATRQTFADWLLYIFAYSKALPGKPNENHKALEDILNACQDSTDLIPSHEAVESEAKALRLYLHAKVNRDKTRNAFLPGHRSGDDLPLTWQPTGEGHPGMAASSFGDRALLHMRLFRTRDEYYLGKGLQSVDIGDEICVFPGAEVPFILRKIPGTEKWKFVGQAYLHGVMHGEVSSRWQGREQQEFIIE